MYSTKSTQGIYLIEIVEQALLPLVVQTLRWHEYLHILPSRNSLIEIQIFGINIHL